MNTLAQLCVIGALSLTAAGGSWLLRKPPEDKTAFVCDPTKIRSDEICLAAAQVNTLWIDARSRTEWEKNGLSGSILWNMDPKEDPNAMEAEAAPHIATAEFVVVYCGSEKCGTSREVADKIRSLGFGPEVKTLFGGWDAISGSRSEHLAPIR